MDLLQKLNWRYATKEFDTTKKLTTEQLDALLEALRLAPSSFGLQPWKFVVVENAELREKLRGAAWGQAQISEASHLIVLCRKEHVGPQEIAHYVETTAATRGQPVEELESYKKMMEGAVSSKNEEQMAVWADKQVYIALGVLLSAAADMDIDACPMEGFDAAQYDELLDLPAKGLRSVVVAAVGFRSADDKYAAAKKVRFPKEDVIVRM